MSRWRRRLAVLLVLGGLGGSLYAARAWVLPPLGRFLDAGEQPRPADYVMVLPGDESVRPFVAAAVVKAGLAQRVLVPKTEAGPAVADGILPPTDEVIRRVLVGRGVPEDRILLLEGETGHTHGDATLLAALLDGSPDARVTVVTSHFHTRRSRWTFSLVLGDRAGQVSFLSAPTDRFSPENWWRVQEGFTAVTSEYLKLGYYALRYGSLGYWAAGGAVVVAIAAVCYRRRKRLPPAPDPE